MGEEEKKPEENKMEKKPDAPEEKKEKVNEAEKPGEEKKEEPNGEEAKDGKESKEEALPPPPPQEILLKVFMHCEGCARKVRRSLKGFEGVEDVITDCKTQRVVVKGEKADPLKVLERVQKKSHRQVELLSPMPKPPPAEEKKPEEEKPKQEEKKEEPPVTVVVLKVYMHCEACAQEIKKRIMRMKGVESAEPDLKSSEVSVRGVFDPENLVKYVYKRTGKKAVIVKEEVKEKEKGEESKESKEDEKAKEGSGDGKDKKAGDGGDGDGGKSKDKKEAEAEGEAKSEADPIQETKMVELKHEYLYPYYPDRVGYYSYPPPTVQPQPQQYFHFHPGYYNYAQVPHAPQMFSDENPNACSVM